MIRRRGNGQVLNGRWPGARNVWNERYGLALRLVRPLLQHFPTTWLVGEKVSCLLLVEHCGWVNDENQIVICHSELRGLICPHQESNVLYNDIWNGMLQQCMKLFGKWRGPSTTNCLVNKYRIFNLYQHPRKIKQSIFLFNWYFHSLLDLPSNLLWAPLNVFYDDKASVMVEVLTVFLTLSNNYLSSSNKCYLHNMRGIVQTFQIKKMFQRIFLNKKTIFIP